MHLSAFGVESDDFPSITGFIDFEKDTSRCETSYYNPAYKGEVYTFITAEIQKISDLLQQIELGELHGRYTTDWSDQPTSTITIYTGEYKYVVEDYGWAEEESLKKLYGMIYKL